MSTADKRSIIYISLLTVIVCIVSAAAGVGAQHLWERHQVEKQSRLLAVFWESWDLLDEYFYGKMPSPQQRTYGAINGALALLDDPYTIFLEPQPGEIERDRMSGEYGGIGVELWYTDDGAVALSPNPDTPAEAAGLQSGDLLLAVDGDEVGDMTLDEIRTRLRGEVDSTVTLTISRPPDPQFDLTITRAEIQIPSVTWRMLDQDSTIGYLHISSFSSRTPQEAATAVDSLLQDGATKLVLDLRGNGGGLIQPAVEVAGLFLDDETVLYEVRRGEEENSFATDPGGAAADVPLVVLIDNSTASAAEMVAGAIQVHERGPLIGEQSFGKGVVQLVYTLSDGSSLHVTFAVWLLPNHQPLPPDGLTPDIPASNVREPVDETLDRAIRYFQVGE